MPTSPSTRRSTKSPASASAPRSRLLVPLLLIAVLAVVLVAVSALPAALLGRLAPAAVHADDFSGSVWHGSAGRVTVNGREMGALEWHLHPAALLTLRLVADLHWVKVSFVTDATVTVDRHTLIAREVQGGGPLEDIGDVGLANGWHGTAQLEFSSIQLGFDSGLTLLSAVGQLQVANLASSEIAQGAELGGYALTFANGAITPDADATAELTDTGGPLEVRATIHFNAKDHTGLLSGTLKERAGAPPALRSQLDNLTQLHARDAQGRIPVDLEFTL